MVQAQRFSAFSTNPSQTVEEMKQYLSSVNKERQKEADALLAEFTQFWTTTADAATQQAFIESSNKLTQTIVEQAIDCLKEKEEFVGSDIFRQAERSVLLMSVDSKWMDHIDAMDQLQTSIRMRSLAQHDPVVEYKMEGGIMFDEMNEAIQNDSVKLLMKGKFEARQNVQVAATNANGEAASEPAKEAAPAAPMMTSKLAQAASRATASTRSIPTQAEQVKGAAQDNKTIDPVKRDKNKVGRNDPCPCGSGKKYKNCCGKNS